MRFYVGTLDKEPVATSLVIADGAVAGIYWVATREGWRRRGLGEALTWAAVRGGAERGCTVASLQASELGRPVYERMGFRLVVEYAHFLAPDATA